MKGGKLVKKQLVWGRTKGRNIYIKILDPWWPGIITKVLDGNEYAINFIGDDSHAILVSENIYDFEEKLEEFQEKAKTKKLKDSIQVAIGMLKKSESEDEYKKSHKKKKRFTPPATRIQRNKKSQDLNFESDEKNNQLQLKRNQLDRDFQDLLLLLIASQLNYDQIRLKLTPILDTIEAQTKQDAVITEILSERKGSILNAVYMILKHQSEQNPDHFFQRDIQQQISRLQDLISSLKSSLLVQFFDPSTIIKNLKQCCIGKTCININEVAHMLQDVMNIKSDNEDSESALPPRKKGKLAKKLEKEKIKKSKSAQIFQENLNNSNGSNNGSSNLSIQKRDKKKEQQQQQQQQQEQQQKQQQQQQQQQAMNNRASSTQNQSPNENQQQQLVPQKKNNKKSEIVDQHLRRKVCFNMLRVIQQTYKIEEDISKQIVLKIESMGRDQDPQMHSKYGQLMWSALNNLNGKIVKKEELIEFIQEQEDVWNRLIQPVDRNRRI